MEGMDGVKGIKGIKGIVGAKGIPNTKSKVFPLHEMEGIKGRISAPSAPLREP